MPIAKGWPACAARPLINFGRLLGYALITARLGRFSKLFCGTPADLRVNDILVVSGVRCGRYKRAVLGGSGGVRLFQQGLPLPVATASNATGD